MKNTTLTIQDLRDIVIPESVGVWPLSTATWVLLCLLLLSLVVLGWQLLVLWWANTYRRAALRELNTLSPDSHGLHRALEILKRTALVAFPRSEVARLSGEKWVAWLNNAAGDATFTGATAELLAADVYRKELPRENDLTLMFKQARKWIRTHRAEPRTK